MVTIACEKAQAAALVERLELLLKEIRKKNSSGHPINSAISYLRDDKPLEQPIAEDFRAGVMAITWLNAESLVMIETQAISEQMVFPDITEEENGDDDPKLIPDDDLDGPDLLRVKLSLAQVKEFISRTNSVIDAGRQPCTFCGIPIDPNGHLCPRANGYRR
ncbi:unannotated protein [freshwater metagenome]|uniref:Unannotated protein n=1 Tax=freshwater metagenome TaxID=449393 RepID=A0A6J7UFW3_9ZZZZ